MPARVRATARVTWRVVEELAPEPFALRPVITPSYPSPHSHKYTTSPTCQVLPEIQALAVAARESVCGRGPAAPACLTGGHPQAASISLLLTGGGAPLIRITAPRGLAAPGALSPRGEGIKLVPTRAWCWPQSYTISPPRLATRGSQHRAWASASEGPKSTPH